MDNVDDNFKRHFKNLIEQLLVTENEHEKLTFALNLAEFGWDASPIIENRIKTDEIDEKTGFTVHSKDWNYLIITIERYGDKDVALSLASILASREPKNAATLNNLGTVLMANEWFEKALELFKEAYELDVKNSGKSQAKKAPAYSNMILAQNVINQISATSQIPETISSTPFQTKLGLQNVLTRTEWKQLIWGDLIMGLFSGFLVSVLTLWTSLMYNERFALEISFTIAVIGLVGIFILLVLKRQETHEKLHE